MTFAEPERDAGFLLTLSPLGKEGVLPLGPKGWPALAWILLVGSLALTCLPEWFLGRYAEGKSDHHPD